MRVAAFPRERKTSGLDIAGFLIRKSLKYTENHSLGHGAGLSYKLAEPLVHPVKHTQMALNKHTDLMQFSVKLVSVVALATVVIPSPGSAVWSC